jgi:hypothetical protein
LSTGSFLSVNAKFGDTSPTLRGKLVRERLLCEDIPPPPPTVNVDEPPTGDGDSVCKVDRYAVHDAPSGCAACHAKMDPIGFGLEAFDREGRFREHDEGEPDCPISGEGDLDGVAFVGPAGLADLLVEGPDLSACAVEQVVRFAMGSRPRRGRSGPRRRPHRRVGGGRRLVRRPAPRAGRERAVPVPAGDRGGRCPRDAAAGSKDVVAGRRGHRARPSRSSRRC